jgi:DNA-binding response OmpR family regulator
MSKILIIDDHKSWLSVLNSILVQSGFEVKVASTGQGGLEIANTYKPNVILLDLMMPMMNGYEILERVRANNELNATAVIVISARSNTKDQQRAFDLGANDYLVKPVHPIELINRIQELTDQFSQAQQPSEPFPTTS